MNPIANKAIAAGNVAASWLYRRSKGRLGGSAKGIPVLLLTVPGRKTGKPRCVPLAYFEHAEGYLVTASAGGVKANPQWIHNLAAAGRARIDIGQDHHDVVARVTHGEERDRLWQDVVLARAPFFAKYQEKSGRVIPVAHLTTPVA
jgi:deazaflavin-dependent oxidoreductase (nitroreductase family)